MGYSISQETCERLEKNRREGRLCRGSLRCSTRATWQAFEEFWTYKVGEGDSWENVLPMTFCKRHLNDFAPHVGFEGVNYRVTKIEKIPR